MDFDNYSVGRWKPSAGEQLHICEFCVALFLNFFNVRTIEIFKCLSLLCICVLRDRCGLLFNLKLEIRVNCNWKRVWCRIDLFWAFINLISVKNYECYDLVFGLVVIFFFLFGKSG